VRLFTVVGNRVPLHATGAGKALLASLPQVRREALLDRTDLRTYTGKTLIERASLARALDEARERGYALDDEEYDEGVRCVAVAVGPIGAPIAALSISGPASRLTKQRCVEFVPQMKRAAADLADTFREAITT
jgi:IclR family acetate operon transcriptional repressor